MTSENNQSPENLQHHLLWQYENNRSITTNWHYFFLIAYIFLGIVALLANGLVVLAVYRNKKVRLKQDWNLQSKNASKLNNIDEIEQNHSVWKSPKMSHSRFLILAIYNIFCPIRIDLSGNTVWQHNLAKSPIFGIFSELFSTQNVNVVEWDFFDFFSR